MPVTTVRGRGRKAIVLEHCRQKLDEALDKYIAGRVDANFVHERGKKLA